MHRGQGALVLGAHLPPPRPPGGLSQQTPDFLPAGISPHIAGPRVDREGRLSIRWSPVAPEVADALRIAGISLKLDQGPIQVILDPAHLGDIDLRNFNRKVPAVLETIVGGIQTKASKYKNYLGRGHRTTVTLDVTEVPWVLRPEYLRQIRARLWEIDALNEVYFIVNGEAYRIWPF